MAAVGGDAVLHGAVGLGKGFPVIDIVDLGFLAVVLQHVVHGADGAGGVLDLGGPVEAGAGGHGADEGTDAVSLGKLAHGDDVLDGVLEGDHAVVACHVVGACHDEHEFGLEGDDVGLEADEHLAGSLTADAAAGEVVLLEELLVHASPVVGDAVAHEDDLRGLGEFGVGLLVTPEAGPVAVAIGGTLTAVEVALELLVLFTRDFEGDFVFLRHQREGQEEQDGKDELFHC